MHAAHNVHVIQKVIQTEYVNPDTYYLVLRSMLYKVDNNFISGEVDIGMNFPAVGSV